jgi:uncharacterized protein (TIGR02996 family)
MTDREALLRAVCENPDDDLPRLVFADWLEEHDEPDRAEFIRLQCEMAKSIYRFHPRYSLREKRFLDAHNSKWRLELPEHPNVTWHEFRRGFVDSATIDSGMGIWWIAKKEPYKTPLRLLRFSRCRVEGRFWKYPMLSKLAELELDRCVFEDADVSTLADTSCLPRLKRLTFSPANGISDNLFCELHRRFGNDLRY